MSHSVVFMEAGSQMPLVGTSMFETPSSLKFRQSPLDVPLNHKDVSSHPFKDGGNTVADGISADFREALKMLTIDDDAKLKRQPYTDNRIERITDAFHRGEKLLLSNDNARPKSRSKTALSINNLHKVTPAVDTERNSAKSAKRHHSYISEDNMNQIFGDISAPVMFGERNNGSNNANNEAVIIKNVLKKDKKLRKRAKTTVKIKKSKQGRISIPSTGVHNNLDKHSSAPSISSPISSTTAGTRQRVSSEPPSKLSLSSLLSCAPHSLNSNHTTSKLYTSAACKVLSRDSSSAPTSTGTLKQESNNNTAHVIHFTHGSAVVDPTSSQNVDNALNAQGMPVTVHKAEMNNRVKSGHSIKSIRTMSEDSIARDYNNKGNTLSQLGQDLALSAKTCSLHITPKQNTLANTQRRGSGSSFSAEYVTKEAALTAIYGAVHQTANRIASQIEELKRVKKIFLSDRQSGTLKENGVEYPCAPPATPNPDLVRNYEYVPCMSDIRSQRAVKSRLQVMERDAQKKKEKKKEAQAKQEKQLVKDREKSLKAQQRREIYALNKIMTELENKRFLEFCNSKGLRT